MKKNIIKFVILSLFTATFFSCSNTEDDLFEEPSSMRLEKNKERYSEILESSKEGWVLQYFPQSEQKYGGVNFYLKFKDGNVTASMEGTNTEATSIYSLLNRGGNILSFNLYNSVLHYFATPAVNKDKNINLPKGLEGDFEFLILSQEEDRINLKGLRTGNLMTLIKLNDSKVYKDKSKEIADFISDATLGAKIKDTTVKIFLENSNLIFEYEENNQKNTERIAFVTTDKGIKLYKPITINGVTAREFTFDKKNNVLSNIDKKFVLQVILPPMDFSQKWSLTIDPQKNEVCQKIIDIQNQAADAIDKLYAMLFLLPQYDFGTLSGSGDLFGIRFDILDANTTIVYGSSYKLKFAGVLGDDTLLDIIPISPYTEDQGSFWGYFPPLKMVLDNFVEHSPYKIEKDDEDNPSVVKMISTKDPDMWFIIKK